jgi:hypothetical protein
MEMVATLYKKDYSGQVEEGGRLWLNQSTTAHDRFSELPPKDYAYSVMTRKDGSPCV